MAVDADDEGAEGITVGVLEVLVWSPSTYGTAM